MPLAALKSPQLSQPEKVFLLAVDEAGHRSRCRLSRNALAARARISERMARRATENLTRAGYLRRNQITGTKWEFQLLKRTPAVWLPGWGLHYYRSPLAEDLPAAGLLLWAVTIASVPTVTMQHQTPGLGPWSERSAGDLAQAARISRNQFGEVLTLTAQAGLCLAVTRPRRRPIIMPTVEPETRLHREDRASYMLAALQDRDGPLSQYTVLGLDAPTVFDDTSLTEMIATSDSRSIRASGASLVAARGGQQS